MDHSPFLNLEIPKKSSFKVFSTSTRRDIAPGLWVAMDPNRGKIRIKPGQMIALDFSISDPAPAWMEIGIVVPGGEWRKCRQILLRYQAHGSDFSVTPALRLGYPEGMQDHFSDETHAVGADTSEFGSSFLMPPRLVAGAEWMDLHLFFGVKSGSFTLVDLALTGVK